MQFPCDHTMLQITVNVSNGAKNLTVWYVKRFSMSTYTGVTNFQKQVFWPWLQGLHIKIWWCCGILSGWCLVQWLWFVLAVMSLMLTVAVLMTSVTLHRWPCDQLPLLSSNLLTWNFPAHCHSPRLSTYRWFLLVDGIADWFLAVF